jgi:glutamate--cysteine ligase
MLTARRSRRRTSGGKAVKEFLLLENLMTKTETVKTFSCGVIENSSHDVVAPNDISISQHSTPLFIEHIRQGAKPRSEFLCGLECELFGYDVKTLERLNQHQVADVLKNLSTTENDLYFENGILAESKLKEGGRLTLEPGGQIEFSSAPRKSLNEIEKDYKNFLSRLKNFSDERGFTFLAIGFDPLRKIAEQNWYPKPRYEVMRPYLATRGARAWDMMTRTAGIQVNLDYDSEEDLRKKFIAGNLLAPIVTAMFANSPFENGKPSGYKSTRLAAWLQTDDERSGISPIAFNKNFTIEDFVAYALDVPMLFTRREDSYFNKETGTPFKKYLEQSRNGSSPIFQDFTDHLTTIFTEARLKQYIELRSMDCGNFEMVLAAQALWKGLLYDKNSLNEALRLAPQLNQNEMRVLQEKVLRDALNAKHEGVDVLGLAKQIIEIAEKGLQRIAPDETKYLELLKQQVIEDEVCSADILIKNWNGSIEKVIESSAVTPSGVISSQKNHA